MGSASVKKPWIETPLLESTTLSQAAGCRIFLKLENLQPSASFKSRGVGNFIFSYVQNSTSSTRQIHFYSSSGGNAGLACVTAASSLGYPSSVIVPTSTEKSMILKLRAAGVTDVVSYGSSWMYADEYLRKTVIPQAEAKGEIGVYVPPFDHPLVWDGASTMIHEIHQQLPNGSSPDAIVCSVGGGGLFAGIMQGLDDLNLGHKTQVLAVETEGADSLSQSVKNGELITLPAITSIATSLGAVRVAKQPFKLASTRPANIQTVVLDDAEAVMGSVRFADDERILVEPACGASVALAYDGRLKALLINRKGGFNKDTMVVIVVCGGSRVSLGDLMVWKEKYQTRAKELAGERWGATTGGGGDHQDEKMVPSNITTATTTTTTTTTTATS